MTLRRAAKSCWPPRGSKRYPAGFDNRPDYVITNEHLSLDWKIAPMTIAPRQLAGVPITLLAFAACAALPVHAQQLSVVRAGSFEIDPFVGASYGIDQTRVMGGANVSFAIKDRKSVV